MDHSFRPIRDIAVPIGRRLEKPWFVYTRNSLRLQAVPVSAAGWVSLGAALIMPAVVALAVARGATVEAKLLSFMICYASGIVVLICLIRVFGNRFAAPTEVMRDGGSWLWRAAKAERGAKR